VHTPANCTCPEVCASQHRHDRSPSCHAHETHCWYTSLQKLTAHHTSMQVQHALFAQQATTILKKQGNSRPGGVRRCGNTPDTGYLRLAGYMRTTHSAPAGARGCAQFAGVSGFHAGTPNPSRNHKSHASKKWTRALSALSRSCPTCRLSCAGTSYQNTSFIAATHTLQQTAPHVVCYTVTAEAHSKLYSVHTPTV
jgi:hypothetical protein